MAIELDKRKFVRDIKKRFGKMTLEEMIAEVMTFVYKISPDAVKNKEEDILKQFPDLKEDELTWAAFKMLAHEYTLYIQEMLKRLEDLEGVTHTVLPTFSNNKIN